MANRLRDFALDELITFTPVRRTALNILPVMTLTSTV